MCDLWAQNLIPFQNKPTHKLKTHFPKEMDFSFCFLSLFLGRFNQRGWKHILFWLFSLLSHIISSFKNFAMLQKLKSVCSLILADEDRCQEIVFQSKASECRQCSYYTDIF